MLFEHMVCNPRFSEKRVKLNVKDNGNAGILDGGGFIHLEMKGPKVSLKNLNNTFISRVNGRKM